MSESRDKMNRKNFPKGRDGEYLVLDSRMPRGLRWRKGVDRLITDMTPELAGDLDANNNNITGIKNLTFTNGQGEVAGIDNENLVDKTASETIAGAWTYNSNLAMGSNKITGLGNPTGAQDAATKSYVDTQHAGYLCASGVWSAGAWGGTLGAGANFMPIATITAWTLHAPNDGWTESSKEFEYEGTYPASGTKTFLVQYRMQAQFYTTGATGATVALACKITKDTGSGHADVPGSLEISDQDHYTTGFGAFFHFHTLSGSCIVSVDAGHKLAFNIGTFGFGTYVPVALATTAGTEGATITITPIG